MPAVENFLENTRFIKTEAFLEVGIAAGVRDPLMWPCDGI
jgi:hypothetical protein